MSSSSRAPDQHRDTMADKKASKHSKRGLPSATNPGTFGVGGRASAKDNSTPKNTREDLGKSKSLPALENHTAPSRTKTSLSDTSCIDLLKQRSTVPEEREVQRFRVAKLGRTLSQLVGSEHSLVEDPVGDAFAELTEDDPLGGPLSLADFPSTIGIDSKLRGAFKVPPRSTETAGEGKRHGELILQGEVTAAPTSLDSSVTEATAGHAFSDLEAGKKTRSPSHHQRRSDCLHVLH